MANYVVFAGTFVSLKGLNLVSFYSDPSSADAKTDTVRGIAVDPAGAVIEVGEFRDSTGWNTGTVDLDPGPDVDNYQSSYYSEAFVRKWDFSLVPAL